MILIVAKVDLIEIMTTFRFIVPQSYVGGKSITPCLTIS